MRLVSSPAFRLLLYIALAGSFVLTGCDTNSNGSQRTSTFNLDNCTIPTDQLAQGCAGPDCIPALTNPELAAPGTEAANYLADTSRVIGLLIGEQPLAVPHNILWRHEIINFDNYTDRPFAVTYCPLTGSSLAFDRGGEALNGAELGVSGLLFDNNLVMYDRRENRSLWPQMNRRANCGANVGADLTMLPVVEMRWGRWKGLHPDTRVVSKNTRYVFDYTESGYPYGDYEQKNNDRVLYDMGPLDQRRPPKERVLGIPAGDDGGLALPFGVLDEMDSNRAVEVTVGGEQMVVFWDHGGRSAMAYRPVLDGESLSFEVQDGRIVDVGTGSTWTADGRAISGEREGAQLEPIDSAYIAFWFAWAAFQPDTGIWTAGG